MSPFQVTLVTMSSRLRQEELEAERLKDEVRQISDTALHLRNNLEEVSQAKEKTQTAYQVHVLFCEIDNLK